MDARLSRLENRMAVADEVAELALEYLGPLCGRNGAQPRRRRTARRERRGSGTLGRGLAAVACTGA